MADFDWSSWEVSRTGGCWGTDSRFYGERVCEILPSEVSTLAPHYDPARGASGLWPGTEGALAARLTQFKLPPPKSAGRRELILIYREPTPAEALIPGRAVLYVGLGGTASKLYRELELAEGQATKRVIEGPVDDAPAQRWVVVKGSNTVLTPGATLRVRTAAEMASLPSMWGMIDKYNSEVLPHFMYAPAKSLKFIGCGLGGTLINRKYWALDYHFLYNDKGWDAACTVQKYTKDPVVVGVDDEDGVPVIGREAVLVGWKKVGGEETRNISRGGTTFANLDAMLAWLQ